MELSYEGTNLQDFTDWLSEVLERHPHATVSVVQMGRVRLASGQVNAHYDEAIDEVFIQ